MYIVSVDSGKASTKWATLNQKSGEVIKGLFPTVAKPIFGEQFGAIKTLVVYNAQQYSVGDPKDIRQVPRETSKLKTEHEVSIYTAIAKALKAQGANLNQTQSVHLVLNVPLRDYKSKEERQKYQDRYFQEENQQTVSITVDGQLINFIVSKLTLCYEGQGSLVQATIQHEEMKLEEGFVLLTDIGGCNDSVLLFEDWSPVPGQNDALLNGMLQVFHEVAKTLTQRYDSKITIHDVELLSKGIHPHQAKLPDFDSVYKEQAEKITTDIAQNSIGNALNPTFTKFIFAGGGAQALKPFIQTAFSGLDYVILEDSQYANVLGMLETALLENEGN